MIIKNIKIYISHNRFWIKVIMEKKLADRDSQIDTQARYTLNVQRHPFNVPFGEVSTRWKYVHLSNSSVLPPFPRAIIKSSAEPRNKNYKNCTNFIFH